MLERIREEGSQRKKLKELNDKSNYSHPHVCHSERSEESPSISGDSSPQKARLRMTETGGRVVTDKKLIDSILSSGNLTFEKEIKKIEDFCIELRSRDLLSERSIWQEFVDWRDESPYLSFFLCLTLFVIPLIPWIIARQLANTTQKSILDFQEILISHVKLGGIRSQALGQSLKNLPFSIQEMSMNKATEILDESKNKTNAAKASSEMKVLIDEAISLALNSAIQDAATDEDERIKYGNLANAFKTNEPGNFSIEVDENQNVCFKANFNPQVDVESEKQAEKQVTSFKKFMICYFGINCNFNRKDNSLTCQMSADQVNTRILKWNTPETASAFISVFYKKHGSKERSKAKQKILDGFALTFGSIPELDRLTNGIAGCMVYKISIDLPCDSEVLGRLEIISLKIQALFLDENICQFKATYEQAVCKVEICIPCDKISQINGTEKFSRDDSLVFFEKLLKAKENFSVFPKM